MSDKRSTPWKELTNLTQGQPLEVERVRLKSNGVVLEGRFELPALAQMKDEDQVFISAFLRSDGSIKEMERLFGISYPTVKARLARIADQLPFVETVEMAPKSSQPGVLEQLAKGEIDVNEALNFLKQRAKK